MSTLCDICLGLLGDDSKYCSDDCVLVAVILNEPELANGSVLTESTIRLVRARRSVNEAFMDGYEPVWVRPASTELRELDSDLAARVEFGYRAYAKEQLEAISAQYAGR